MPSRPSSSGGDRQATAPSRAVELIISAIRQGRYVPGQRLIEADLVEELEVSRSSVREALRGLEAQGLIDMIPHRGARVRRLTADDVREIYEVRAIVEAGAARLAAQRIDKPGHRKRLTDRLKALHKAAAAGDVIGYIDAITSYHDTLFELTGNRQLGTIVETARLQTARFTLSPFVAATPALLKRSLGEFEDITERILAGDADRAMVAMRKHIEGVAALALSTLSSLETRTQTH